MNKGLLLPLIFITGFLFSTPLISQTYSDHFGTGQTIGLSVSASDAQAGQGGTNTVSGTDLIPDLVGASRFLGQATLGANYEDIEYVSQIGIDQWLDEQFAMAAPSSFRDNYQSIYDESLAIMGAFHGTANADSTRKAEYLRFAFYQKTLTEDDLLRQKVAFALSQILVTSSNSAIGNRGYGLSSYYDVLYNGSFGNFRDLLGEVTLHPIMGMYLSTFKNKKADPDAGTLPDENYAREVMQLFTIGLFEMNNDGSYQLDANGDLIPTYDINDIQELSHVFTGLSGGAWDLVLKPENAGTDLTFYKGYNHYDLTHPMGMFEEHHETAEKLMIDGSVLPAGQTGMDDINDALDVLFNHPNVGPFISIRLIQQMVKANPSPAYINRVATVFNNNGQGVRGDLEAVVRAILTDPEARNCSWQEDVSAGKIKQPMERFIQLFRAFDISSPSGKLWYKDFSLLYNKLEQSFMASPSVFNFFSPFYAEPEIVAPNELVSPEYEILNATSSIHYINLIETAVKTRPFKNRTMADSTNINLAYDDLDEPSLDFTDEMTILENDGINALIDRLDLIMCHGQLTDDVHILVENVYNQYVANIGTYDYERGVEDVLYFILVTSDYLILE